MSLLDLGDDPSSSAPADPAAADPFSSDPFSGADDPFGGASSGGADPFDPFSAPSAEQKTSSGAFDDFDPFSGPLLSPSAPQDAAKEEDPAADPFANDPFTSSDPFAEDKPVEPSGNPFSDGFSGSAAESSSDLDPFGNQGDDKMAEVTGSEQQQTLEAQFDDLMGGFDGSSVSNGTVVVTETRSESFTTESFSEDQSSQGDREGTAGLSDAGSSEDVRKYSYDDEEEEEAERASPQRTSPQRTSPQRTSPQRTSTSSQGSSRFEDTISDFQPPRRYVKEEKKPVSSNAVSSTYIMGGGSDSMCKVCQKRVYEMEKIIADNKIYHKTCFKCTQCKRVLSLGNFAGINGELYCKPHFLANFKTKGNYEEGFGKERHTRQWQRKDDVDSGTVAPRVAERKEAGAAGAAGAREVPEEVVRGEEAEAPPENLPSIRNLKSRFETDGPPRQAAATRQEAYQQVNGSPYEYEEEERDDADVARETPEKEEVHFTELHSVRSRFESSSSVDSSRSTPSPRKTSKWDKPKEPPPPPVNVQHEYEEEEDEDAELPAADTTRSLVSRFREIEQGEGEVEYDRRPVRKMTPPRDEIEEDIRQFHAQEVERDPDVIRADDPAEREEEKPPQAVTRNIVSKFRELESSAPAPTPQHTPVQKQAAPRKNKSPDSGISDNEAVVSAAPTNGYHNGDEHEAEGGVYENEPVHQADVIRESDNNVEEELPERGFTKSLLAQWQTKLSEAPQANASVPRQSATSTSSRSWSFKEKQPAEQVQQAPQTQRSYSANDDDVDARQEDVVRESDTHEEEYMPPPSYTKNMLAKFQSMEAQNQQQAPPSKPKQRGDSSNQPTQFKWQVKEAQPLNRRYKSESRANGGGELGDEDYEHTRGVDVGAPEDGDYELPHKRAPDGAATFPDQREQPDGDEYEASHPEMYAEGGEYENEPLHDPDVVRESDRHGEEELPEQGTTRSLLAKFQAMQANAY